MKKIFIVAITLLFSRGVLLKAYQPLEPDGLIGVLTAKAPSYAVRAGRVQLEKRNDGSKSRVVNINGRDAFQQAVIVASVQRPVVVFAYSDIDDASAKMRDVCQSVADTFKNKVRFVSMDLRAKQHDVLENYQIIGQIMTIQNINRLGLPLVLFFKDGDLYAPEQEPAIMLQGFYSQEQLADFLDKKFFSPKDQIINTPAQDLTHTPIATQQAPAAGNLESGQKADEKLSLRQRFLNLFKRK